MTTRDTTILTFPSPRSVALDEIIRYTDLVQNPLMTMTRDAVEELVPFLIGSVEEMHKEIVRLRSQLAAVQKETA